MGMASGSQEYLSHLHSLVTEVNMCVMLFAPNLNLTVAPEPDLLLLDSYIRLVESKTIDDRHRTLTPAQRQTLHDAIDRAHALAQEKYGAEQALRVTQLGQDRGQAQQSPEACAARLQTTMTEMDRALEGCPTPVSDQLRSSLEHYCRLAGGYYVEMRCKHLSKKKRYALWQAIFDRHNALLYYTMLGTTEAKHTSETAPDMIAACGAETRDFVRAVYTEISDAKFKADHLVLDT